EGYAACLRKQRQPLAAVAQALRELSREARKGACRDAVLAMAERLDRVLAGRAVAGREHGGRRLAVSHRAERAKAPVVSGPNVEDATRGAKRPALPSALTTDTGAARAEMRRVSDSEHAAAGRVVPAPIAVPEPAPKVALRLPSVPDVSVAAPAGAIGPSVKAPGGKAAAAGPMPRLTVPPVSGRVALPELPDVAAPARPAASALRLRESKGLPPESLEPIKTAHDAQGRARAAAAQAGAAALEKLVESLLAEADWKARKGDHEGAMNALGAVVRDARNSSASALAVQRALPIALAGLQGEDRETILREFEPWVGRLGGERDRELAKLLVLQQRYRDGAFVVAREGLKKFLAGHPGSDLAPRARLLLGLATWRTGDRKESIRRLRDLLARHPTHDVAPRALFLVGYLHFASGEREAAREAFLRVVKDYPKSPFADRAVEFLGGEAAKRAEAEAGKQP
ncbi:tetratricopeptide repeat protein, partial [bacterium]|nr:tetratricopeptide repeat protein [bacterium]